MIVNFQVKIKRKIPFSKNHVNKIMDIAAREMKLKKNCELAVLIVGEKEIKNLNSIYRHKNKVTDVLAFSPREGDNFNLPAESKDYLGEIFICYSQLSRQAQKYGQTVDQEFVLLLIHGFLHLLGYNDENPAADLKMKKIQDRILNKIYG